MENISKILIHGAVFVFVYTFYSLIKPLAQVVEWLGITKCKATNVKFSITMF